MTSDETGAWPALPYDDWRPTKETLHRYAQMVGKVRMALVPPLNHWWNVTLRLTTRGLGTGPMPAGDRYVGIEFDLVDHRLRVDTSTGGERSFDLVDGLACADFHDQLFGALRGLGVDVAIRDRPFDLGDGPAFPDDRVHSSYDADAVRRFAQILGDTERVLAEFAGGFTGKASPTQFFWHTFDLAHARYSGRPAAVAATADPVTAEAYSREVIAVGFWPGDAKQTPYPAFYSYTAPEPEGLAAHRLEPSAAAWSDTGNGHLAVLPYDDVRGSDDPHATLLAFYESAYRAGSTAAGWDVDVLERR